MKTLTWKNGFLTKNYEVYCDGSICGTIRKISWTQPAICKLNDSKYKIKEQGIFNKKLIITSEETGVPVGNIIYNSLKTQAILKLNYGKKYTWFYRNLWQTEWSITGENVDVSYSSKLFRGVIESNQTDELIILAGLYIKSYFHYRMFIIMLFVLIIVLS